MTFKIAFHPLARTDLLEASAWHELREFGLGQRLENEAREIFERLQQNALHYAVRFAEIRRVNLPSFPYGVFYFVWIFLKPTAGKSTPKSGNSTRWTK